MTLSCGCPKQSRTLAAPYLLISILLLVCAPTGELIAQRTRPVQRGVLTLVSLARNAAEHENIFGPAESAPGAGVLRRFADKLSSWLPHSRVMPSASRFLQEIEATRASFVVLVGHNRGGEFVFPNGTSIALASLGTPGFGYGKRFVVVSCEASTYLTGPSLGTKTQISAEEGVEIASRMTQYLSTAEEEGLDSDEALTRALDQIAAGTRFWYLAQPVVGGMTVAGGAVVIYRVVNPLRGP